MTTQFRRTIVCKSCGSANVAEDDISQWVRNNPRLCSHQGFVFMDKDLVCHRYKTASARSLQCIMFVEFKAYGRDLSDVQRDTMLLLDQLIRTTKTTPTKRGRMNAGTATCRAYSHMAKRAVGVRAYGYHLVRMSGRTPDTSEWVMWDKTLVTVDVLEQILRFDLDPDTLRPIDFRVHHKKSANMVLPL